MVDPLIEDAKETLELIRENVYNAERGSKVTRELINVIAYLDKRISHLETFLVTAHG